MEISRLAALWTLSCVHIAGGLQLPAACKVSGGGAAGVVTRRGVVGGAAAALLSSPATIAHAAPEVLLPAASSGVWTITRPDVLSIDQASSLLSAVSLRDYLVDLDKENGGDGAALPSGVAEVAKEAEARKSRLEEQAAAGRRERKEQMEA